jgi:hypothetical protein
MLACAFHDEELRDELCRPHGGSMSAPIRDTLVVCLGWSAIALHNCCVRNGVLGRTQASPYCSTIVGATGPPRSKPPLSPPATGTAHDVRLETGLTQVRDDRSASGSPPLQRVEQHAELVGLPGGNVTGDAVDDL